MGIIHHIRSSFATRFSIFILLVVSAFFVSIFTTFYRKSSQSLTKEVESNVNQLLEISNLEIEKVLYQAERIPDNLKTLVVSGRLRPDSLFALTRDIVAKNDIVFGSAIAYEPNYFPDQGYYFSPYSTYVGDSIVTYQLGNPDYDYFSMDWYLIPKLLNQPYWTEPYFEEGITIITYSSPMYDSAGAFIGIFTIDLSLEWLSDVMNAHKPYPNAYNFMIGRGGTYILHANKEHILNASIFSVALEKESPEIYTLGQDMVDGERGSRLLTSDGVRNYVIFAPVSHLNWSSAFVCPTREVFASLQRTRTLFLVLGLLGLLVTFACCYFIIKRLLRPILAFAETANVIASGNLDAQLPAIRSHDEMKDLHDAFANMQADLKTYIATLTETTSAKEKIESELHIAREIQMGMIPKIFPPYPERNDVDIYARLIPAKEVGGDLYDFFIKEEHLYFAIGDVSGKGVPASLLMAVTRSLFRTVSMHFADVLQIVDSINNAVSEDNESNMFVTLFIGILDLQTGALSYCNAGHNAPVLLCADKKPVELPVVSNLPVGIMPGFAFEKQETVLSPATTLFLYTDGLNEAEDVHAQLFGMKRMFQALARLCDFPAQPIVERMTEAVQTHVREAAQSDDLTLLAIGYKTREGLDKTLTLQNRMEDIEKVHAFLGTLQNDMGLDDSLAMQLNLALEEVVANCIMYAYKDATNQPISIKARLHDHVLTFTVVDYGVPFDPTAKEDPDINLSAEDRPIGGLGLFLVKQIMDHVEYARVDNANMLLMKKSV